MTPIAEWSCLKAGRDNFTVRPDVDAQFFFGRATLRNSIRKQLRYGLSVMGVPKMVIYGPYGAGKTHTLHHIKWYLENEPGAPPCEVRVVKTPLLSRNSPFAVLHAKLVDAMGLDYVRDAVNAFMGANPGTWFERLSEVVVDANIAYALRGLSLFGTMQLTAWRWLMGEKIPDVDQANLNITRSYHSPEDLVQILRALGSLVRDVHQQRLVLLIDEAELLDGVRIQEAVDSFVEAMRLLASDDNPNVGFVVAAIRSDEGESSNSVLLAGSVKGRLGEQNYIEIPPLEPIVAKEFARDLLSELVDSECGADRRLLAPDHFPFTQDAFDLLEQWITEDPTRQLPRQIIQALNNGAFAAWESEEEVVTGSAMARGLDL